jgi:hypothetical protein
MGVRLRTTPSTPLVRSQSVVACKCVPRACTHTHTHMFDAIYMQMCEWCLRVTPDAEFQRKTRASRPYWTCRGGKSASAQRARQWASSRASLATASASSATSTVFLIYKVTMGVLLRICAQQGRLLRRKRRPRWAQIPFFLLLNFFCSSIFLLLRRHRFSYVLPIVTLCIEYTRALIFAELLHIYNIRRGFYLHHPARRH